MRDPGLDRHEWQTQWEQLEPLLEDSATETLPEVGDLIEQMLLDRGYPVNDPVADAAVEPAILVEFRSAREITERVDRGDDVDPGDVGEAIQTYRDIYERLLEEMTN